MASVAFATLMALIQLVDYSAAWHTSMWLFLGYTAGSIGLIWVICRPSSVPDASGSRYRWFGILIGSLLIAGFFDTMYRYAEIIRDIPIDPQRGDMLTNIEVALARWLGGQSLYGIVYAPWPTPVSYLPALNLSFLPAKLLNLDIRWAAWVWFGLFLGLLIRLLFERRHYLGFVVALAAMLVFFMYSGFSENFMIIGHTAFIWLGFLAFGWAVVRGSMLEASALLGVLLVTRETAWLVVPFYFLYLYRRSAMWPAAGHLLLVATIVVAAMTPFFDLEGLQRALAYKSFIPSDIWHHGSQSGILRTIGVSNLAFTFGVSSYLKWLAAVVVMGLLGSAWRRGSDYQARDFLAMAGLAIFTFVGCSGVPFLYAYIPALILFLMVVLADPSDAQTASLIELDRSPGWAISPVGLIASAIVLVVATRPLGRIDLVDRRVGPGNFHQPERDGQRSFIWGGAGEQSFNVYLAEYWFRQNRPMHFAIQLLPNPCVAEQAEVDVAVNNQNIGVLRIHPGWHEYRLTVPHAELVSGPNTMTFTAKEVESPASCGRGQDHRVLSVGYGSLRVIGVVPTTEDHLAFDEMVSKGRL